MAHPAERLSYASLELCHGVVEAFLHNQLGQDTGPMRNSFFELVRSASPLGHM